MHIYWTGVAADLRRMGDPSLEWLLREFWLLVLAEAVAHGKQGGLGAVLQAELAQDVRDVAFDRALAHNQGAGDLFVAATVGEQAQDFALAIGELGAGVGLARTGDLLHQPPRYLGMELRLAGPGATDGAGKVRGGDVF